MGRGGRKQSWGRPRSARMLGTAGTRKCGNSAIVQVRVIVGKGAKVARQGKQAHSAGVQAVAASSQSSPQALIAGMAIAINSTRANKALCDPCMISPYNVHLPPNVPQHPNEGFDKIKGE